MENFKKLTKNDISLVAHYFEKESSLSCDCSIGGCFIWCDFFDTHYALLDDTLIFRISLDKKTRYTYPIGKSIESALSFIEQDAKENGIPTEFFVFSESDFSALKNRYPLHEIEDKREYYDYIYDYSSMCDFKGKKFSGQRNHVNKFKRLYENYSFEEINETNKNELSEFFRRFTENSEKKNAAIEAETIKIFDVLENMSEYHQFGGILRVDGNIVGFSIAEKIGKTMFVHVEKADISYDGAYQMLVSCFASHFADEAVIYINREDDVGDEGLRKSKLSYHPLFLVEKHIFTAKNEQ